MTSIHVNHGAMLALTTLSNINQNLLETQNAVSTGKEVSSSADDAAVWAVTTVMASDVDGFQAISSSLSLGKATLTVARNAAEKVTDLLRDAKSKIVTAQGENVDRDKIQTDINELRKQVGSVVNAAQFNGLNLINGASEDPFLILSSLDRSGDGVTASHISVARQDLSFERTTEAVFGAGDAILNPGTMANLGASNDGAETFDVKKGAATATFEISIGDKTINFEMDAAVYTNDGLAGLKVASLINSMGVEGVTASADGAGEVTISNSNSFTEADVEIKVINEVGAGTWGIDATSAVGAESDYSMTLGMSSGALEFTGRAVSEGDSYRVGLQRSIEGADVDFTFEYVARDGDTLEDVAAGIQAEIEKTKGFEDVTFHTQTKGDDVTLGGVELRIDHQGGDIKNVVVSAATGGTPGVGDGGLFALTEIDVSTGEGAEKALDSIEGLIQIGIDAAAAFGSSEKRVANQSEFVKSLVDNLNSGISALADTDMEKASAKLQALQVQQQLATQSLTIANKAPQGLLGLFR